MNSNYFECKISYLKTMDDGMDKKVNESIMVDALSFTESEARVTEEMNVFDCLTIKEIKRSNYAEIVVDSNDIRDKFFKCKASTITLDEKSGREKKSSFYVLVNGNSVADALDVFNEKIVKTTMADIQLAGITETTIADVIFTAETVEKNTEEGVEKPILVRVQCNDMFAVIEKNILSKPNFDISFENGMKLSFVNEIEGIICVDISKYDNFGNVIQIGAAELQVLRDKYISKELKYSSNK